MRMKIFAKKSKGSAVRLWRYACLLYAAVYPFCDFVFCVQIKLLFSVLRLKALYAILCLRRSH